MTCEHVPALHISSGGCPSDGLDFGNPLFAFNGKVRALFQFAQQYPARSHHGLAVVIVIILRLTLVPDKHLPGCLSDS
jgi:hypothetical protein